MNTEELNRYASTIYRCAIYSAIFDSEWNYLAQFKGGDSGIRNELHRLKNVHKRGMEDLIRRMPNEGQNFKNDMARNEEVVSAIGNIVSMCVMVGADNIDNLLKIEDVLNNLVKVNYK